MKNEDFFRGVLSLYRVFVVAESYIMLLDAGADDDDKARVIEALRVVVDGCRVLEVSKFFDGDHI